MTRVSGSEQLLARRDALLASWSYIRDLAEYLVFSGQDLGPAVRSVEEQAAGAFLVAGVVGAEGAGKSTFVNALLGADIVPRERDRPGTVAPVYVRWSADAEPQYIVYFTEQFPIACQDREEFRSLILDRFNPENSRGVEAGDIRIRAELLSGGLLLVDCPGFEGVSSVIADQVRQLLAQLDRVILIVRDRQYGPAGRLLSSFPQLRPAAIVVNCGLDDWIDPDEDMRSFAREREEAVREILPGLGDEVPVFVLHVPSVGRGDVPGRAVDKYHDEQEQALRQWLDQTVSIRAIGAALNAWSEAIDQCVAVLQERLDETSSLVSRLHSETPADLEKRRTDALRRAIGAVREEAAGTAFRAQVEACWDEVRGALTAVRDQMNSSANVIRNGAPFGGRDWDWDWEDLLATTERENQRVAAAISAVDDLHEKMVLRLAASVRQYAQTAAEHLLRALPGPVEPLAPVHIEGTSLVGYEPASAGARRFMEIFDTKRIAQRVEREFRSNASAVDTSPAGESHASFAACVDDAGRKFESALADYSEHLCAQLRTPPASEESFTGFLKDTTERLSAIKAELAVHKNA